MSSILTLKTAAVVVFAAVFSSMAMAQSSSRSKSYSFNIVREVKPPVLSIDPSSIKFVDCSSNNAIDAGETDAIKFELANNGFGPGYNCKARVKISGNTRDITVGTVMIPAIEVGKKVSVTIPVTAGMNTETGKLLLELQVDEPNGFGVSPIPVEIATKAFVSPMLKVTDYAVTGTTGTLQKLSKFDLQLLLQNVDYGNAQDVNVNVTFPDNIFVLAGSQLLNYDVIESGQTKSLEYQLIANNNYDQDIIPVKVSIRERYGKYSEDRVINLAFNQSLSGKKISIQENESGPKQDIKVATLGSDVDKEVPVSGRKNKNTFAVIIANEHYQNDASVDYATNDGMVFREYCLKTLGIPEDNIRLAKDATYNNIRGQVDWVKKVADAYDGEARIIFYYSGHGLPDDATRSAYLLPVDGDGRNPKGTGLSLDNLYKDLASCKTESTLVLLDACFSGARKDGGMLVSAKGVVIAPEETDPYGNLVVMSAATGEQTAFKYDDESHGMFTYYLLKGLKETGGEVTLGELSDYVIKNVKRTSVTATAKNQTPTVLTGSAVASDWRNIKF